MAKRKPAAQDTHETAQQAKEHRMYRDHVHRIRTSDKDMTTRDQRQLCYHASNAGIGLSEVLKFVLDQDVAIEDLVPDLKALLPKEPTPSHNSTAGFTPARLVSPV
ncbi:hypothetical protein EPN95_02385 [Patescibacteria group bacterium]|nr:MAG: hypothetical protein EPN95_02385 [Patescibacteria group bacterium]